MECNWFALQAKLAAQSIEDRPQWMKDAMKPDMVIQPDTEVKEKIRQVIELRKACDLILKDTDMVDYLIGRLSELSAVNQLLLADNQQLRIALEKRKNAN